MKNSIRLVMIFSAGLSLAGCASQESAMTKQPSQPVLAYGDKPQSASDHFAFRDQEDREERAREKPGR